MRFWVLDLLMKRSNDADFTTLLISFSRGQRYGFAFLEKYLCSDTITGLFDDVIVECNNHLRLFHSIKL